MARLKEQYQNEFVDALIKKFGYKTVMQVPKLDKIVINMGVGEAKENAKVLDSAVKPVDGADELPVFGPQQYKRRFKNDPYRD